MWASANFAEKFGASKQLNGIGNFEWFIAKATTSLPKYSMPLFVKFVDENCYLNNHKIRKVGYRNDKLPNGSDGNANNLLLKNYKEYVELTQEEYGKILNGESACIYII